MVIGFDFDNTIVNYDQVFHQVACEQKLIPAALSANKTLIRDHLHQHNQFHTWTEMQGYVYGARMNDAKLYPGVLATMQQLKNLGHQLVIVSHKTRFPYRGEAYDLHTAARNWIEKVLKDVVAAEDIYFELSKLAKLQRIQTLDCHLFVDDLPEILFDSAFPSDTKKILFDPEHIHQQIAEKVNVIHAWDNIQQYI